MDGLTLPDTVIGLGGSGKNLVFRTLTQQSGDGDYWLLEELTAERNSTANRIDFYTVDTATDEIKDDRPKAKEINEAIDEIETRHRSEGIDHASVNHEYVNLGDSIGREYNNDRGAFVHQDRVGDRLRNTDLTHWWLNKDDLPSGLDFSEGVLRRRARSKGMYYAAKQGGREISSLVQAAGNEVALVTALGGGTGSGMFLDLAREIDADGTNVTLFAVVPNAEEDAEKRANAHAALSELEFLQLTDQNPFRNIVLLPFHPVSENGQHDAHQIEFMDAFPYTLLSYYNVDNNNFHRTVDSEVSGYHPFTIAAPQVIRYNTAHLDQAKRDIEAFFDDKEELLEDEIELYDELREFLTENYDDAASCYESIDAVRSLPDTSEVGPIGRGILQRRFDDIKTLANLETFEQLNCEAPGNYRPLFKQEEEAEGIVETIGSMAYKRSMDPEKTVDSDFSIDPRLDEILDREIDALVKKALVMELAERTGDDQIRDHLVLGVNKRPDKRDVEGNEELETARQELSRRQNQLETDREETQNVIDAAEAEIDSAMERAERKAADEIDQLRQLRADKDDLLTSAETIDNELGQIETQLNRETDPDNLERIGFDADTSELDGLAEIGAETPPDLTRTVDYLTSARAAALRHDGDDDQIIDRVKQWINGDEEQHQARYEGYVTSLRKQSSETYGQPADLPRWDRRGKDVTFEIDLESTVREAIESREQRLLGQISTEYKTAVDELAENDALDASVRDAMDDVDATMSTVRERYEDTDDDNSLFDLLSAEIEETALAGHRSDVDDLTEQLDETEADLDRIQNAIEFYVEHNDLTGFAATEAELSNRLTSLGVDQGDDGSTTDHRYIKRVDPQDAEKLLDQSDIRSSDFWSQERTEVVSTVEDDLVGNKLCRDSTYFRLRSVGSELTSNDQESSRSQYANHVVFPVLMSRVFDEERTPSFDIRSKFSGRNGYGFNLNAGSQIEQYDESYVQNGGPWDVAVTVFVGGVFLDNLKEMDGDQKSLPKAYEHQQRNGTDPIRLHHAWGLGGEDRSAFANDSGGMFVRRDHIMNLNARSADDPSVLLDQPPRRFLNDSDDIEQTILDEFYDVQEFTLDHPYNTQQVDD